MKETWTRGYVFFSLDCAALRLKEEVDPELPGVTEILDSEHRTTKLFMDGVLLPPDE